MEKCFNALCGNGILVAHAGSDRRSGGLAIFRSVLSQPDAAAANLASSKG
jgi:hypothetical protein